MSEIGDRLFDDSAYNRYKEIEEALGCRLGEKSQDQPLITVSFNNRSTVQYRLGSQYRSTYDDDEFTWGSDTVKEPQLKGFLYGLTTFGQEDDPHMLHMFLHATDVVASSIAVLLKDIRMIEVASGLENALVAAQHNAELDGTSRKFSVPVLKDERTGHWLTRPATADEIAEALGSVSLPRSTRLII